MASKVYSRSAKGTKYGIIQRGASFTLPVEVKDESDKPIDLTGLSVEFTIKKVKTDFDRHDDFAYVAKSFLPQMPEQGKFYVLLSSDDMDFEPGQYYFDVELVQLREIAKEETEEEEEQPTAKPVYEYGMVFRLFTFEFTLDGGPTNRRVNKGMGQWPTGDTITVITLAEGNPIIVVAPTVNLDGDLFGHIATLEEMIESLESRVDESDGDVDNLRKEIAKIKKVLKNLRQEFDSDHVEFDDVKGDIEDIQKEIEDMKEAAEQKDADLSAQGLALKRLENRVSHWIEHIHRLDEFCEAVDKAFKLHLWNDLPNHDIEDPESEPEPDPEPEGPPELIEGGGNDGEDQEATD